MRTVELKAAFHWHCEDCGLENFALPRKAELHDDEREAAYRRFNDLDEWAELPEGWREFELVMVPERVTCQCGATFGTLDEESA